MENEKNTRDFFVCTTTNQDVASGVRKTLMSNFPRIWVCVINDGHGVYRIQVANNWGSRLPKNKEDSITLFVQKYMDEHIPPEEEEFEDDGMAITMEELKKIVIEGLNQKEE